jgi:hypothetical protein
VSNYVDMGNGAVIDFDRGRTFFNREQTVCSDCGKPKPFMVYESGTAYIDGVSYFYELCKGCVDEGYRQRWAETGRPTVVS